MNPADWRAGATAAAAICSPSGCLPKAAERQRGSDATAWRRLWVQPASQHHIWLQLVSIQMLFMYGDFSFYIDITRSRVRMHIYAHLLGHQETVFMVAGRPGAAKRRRTVKEMTLASSGGGGGGPGGEAGLASSPPPPLAGKKRQFPRCLLRGLPAPARRSMPTDRPSLPRSSAPLHLLFPSTCAAEGYSSILIFPNRIFLR